MRARKSTLIIVLSCLPLLTACSWPSSDASNTKIETATSGQSYFGTEIPDIPGSLSSQIVNYEGFTVSYNKDTGCPNWSAWELTAEESAADEHSRKEADFWQDPKVDGCHSSKEYSRSGLNRGHLCPAADMKWSAEAMRDCFSMANIAPQSHSLNSGAWNTLEKKCREWAQRDSSLLIVAGPIFDESFRQTIANGAIHVPSAFFKVIAAPHLNAPRGIAFVYPNSASPGNMEQYAMSIDDLEQLTGYDFFPTLPEALQQEIEGSFNFKEWNGHGNKKHRR